MSGETHDFGSGPVAAHRHRNPDGSVGGWVDDGAFVGAGAIVGASATDLKAHASEYRRLRPDVPVVEGLDRKILEAVTIGGGTLTMSSWHTCKTEHCRAGWTTILAGAAGAALEGRVGPHAAGVMIYRASTGRVPDFFASNEDALADIMACAAEQPEPRL